MKNSDTFNIFIERAVDNQDSQYIPDDKDIHRWISTTLTSQNKAITTELGVRITDNNEIHNLNKTYRHKDKPTNVLSFPFEVPKNFPEDIENEYIGDIICSIEYINKEAHDQNKEPKAHWAHIIIHGTLHLLGFDHIEDNDAEIMEQKEIDILESLGYKNPYLY